MPTDAELPAKPSGLKPLKLKVAADSNQVVTTAQGSSLEAPGEEPLGLE